MKKFKLTWNDVDTITKKYSSIIDAESVEHARKIWDYHTLEMYTNENMILESEYENSEIELIKIRDVENE